LVDAGENGKGRAIKKILDVEGINRIDYFVNTHYDKDHYGGIDELVDAGISIGVASRICSGQLPTHARNWPRFFRHLRQNWHYLKR
jgi:beta-lactamase superfamily II metal-dependent hydrolase